MTGIDFEKEKIRMELYKESYLMWLPKKREYTNNIAESMAEMAVKSFDKQFNTTNH